MFRALFVSLFLLLAGYAHAQLGFSSVSPSAGAIAAAAAAASKQGVPYLSAVSSIIPVLNGSTATNTTIPKGSSAVLTWDSIGARSCDLVGFSIGSAVSGTLTVSPPQTTTYSVKCGGVTATAIVTVSGTLIDAAAKTGVGGCTGNGTSGSPWNYLCIQNAVNSASDGDTVFLRGGNWALNTGDATFVTINKPVNLIGAGGGNTFDAWGHISNPSGADQCPTSGSSITCVYMTGTSHPFGYTTTNGGAGNPAGFISFGSLTPFSATCINETVAHIFFDGSLSTDGGGKVGLLNFVNCDGPIFISDIRFLAFNNSGISPETQFYFFQTNGSYTVQNSLMADPLASPGPDYSNAQTAQFNGAYTNGVIMQNNAFYMGGFNPIYISNLTFAGNQQYDYNDGLGGTAIKPAYGFNGSRPGSQYSVYCPQAGATSNGLCNGDVHAVTANNLFYAPGQFFGTGGGLNDPGTSGDVNDLNWSGNWILADDGELDACAWGGCFANIVGMAINTQVDTSCNESYNSPYLYNVTNNSIKATTQAVFDERGGLVTSFTGSISATTLTAPANTVNVGNIITGAGVTANTSVTAQTNSTTYTVNNSQNVASETLSATVAITCDLGNPFTGSTQQIPITVYGFNGQHNYLSSPSNQYLTDSNTISPVQQNNFCASAAGTVTGCATSGFTTSPTVSFSLGTLSNGTVNIVSPSFTAQYGAVQWLASTFSAPPLASDSRWSSNNAFYISSNPATLPPSAPNSYVPPTQLSGVSHGQTVYMWVMDSASNISATASAVIP